MSSSPGEDRAAASPPWPSPAAALGSRCSSGSTVQHPPGRGILLHPNGLAVLYALGLGEALRSRAHVSSAGSIRDERGRTILDVPVPNFGAGLDHVLAVRRSHLTGVLADAVAATPGIEVITGAEVIDADSSGAVSYRSPRRRAPSRRRCRRRCRRRALDGAQARRVRRPFEDPAQHLRAWDRR